VEENEELTAQLNALHVQQGGGNVSDLLNNTTALERETKIEELKDKLEALEQERDRDRDRWKDRIREVEEGVGKLVKELEDRAADAERRAMASSQRAKKRAEEAEAAGQELQADRVLREELHRAEEESARLREESANMKTRLATVDATKLSLQKHASQLEEQLQKSQAQIEELNSALASSEDNAEGFAEELAGAQVELDSALEDVDALRQRVIELEERAETAEEAAVGLTRALEDAEARIVQHEEEVGALQARTCELERRNASFSQSRDQSQSRGGGGLTTITEERSTFVGQPDSISRVSQASQAQEHIQELEILERELDTAHREIARLNHLLSNSPTRTALQQAKDVRIAMLEKEKVELEERVRTLKVMLGGSGGAGTSALLGGISPAVNRTLALLKTPKTPGGPLREVNICFIHFIVYGTCH
jgi:chromosome segregation ATPase